jgi:hypothetical protein
MTSPREPAPGPEPVTRLAARLDTLHGQITALKARLDNDVIGKHLTALAEIKQLRARIQDLEALNLAEQLAGLARTVTDALDTPPAGPPAPYWIGLDPCQHATQLTELRQWTDTVLRTEYGGYQVPACWASHPHAIWELSTLAAEWHRTYNRKRPDLDRALEFHDRWLPGTIRRLADITRRCNPQCITQGQRRGT